MVDISRALDDNPPPRFAIMIARPLSMRPLPIEQDGKSDCRFGDSDGDMGVIKMFNQMLGASGYRQISHSHRYIS